MKKPVLLVAFAAVMAFAITSTTTNTHANANGAPAGRTGSPGDGSNCTNCHSGTASSITGAITSDIPSSGYINGATYNFSATISGGTNYGFEISPQTSTGTLVGTLINGTSGSKLISTSKYITHTAAPTGTSKTWTFQWKAPATGITTAVFYGAFIVGNGNGSDNGDQCKLTTYTATANTTGIEAQNKVMIASVFPNPASEQLSFKMAEACKAGHIFNVSGALVRQLSGDELSGGKISLSELPEGVYYLALAGENQNYYAKFIKQ